MFISNSKVDRKCIEKNNAFGLTLINYTSIYRKKGEQSKSRCDSHFMMIKCPENSKKKEWINEYPFP